MRKKKILFLIAGLFFLFAGKKVDAFDVNNYRNRNLCGTFEVAGFHGDGYIDKVECFSNFDDAKNFMKSNGAEDLAIMTKVNGATKIVDANVALLDMSVNPTTLTYFYENKELTSRQYTYMDTGSLYGGVDAGLIDTAYANGRFVAKVRIGNFTGWVSQEAYEMVPITWLKSYSNYTVTSESIRHNYVTKIQNDYRSSGGSTIGPKPDMLAEGTYYSYDGHYFYNDIKKLIKDYKNNTYANSVNKDKPYYNYYMYLSNHTRTNYSSTNINEYIRNNLGYKKDVYGHIASDGTSRLYGSGTFFYYAQEKYGVNAILSLSLSRNETGNGRSKISVQKNNGFGLNAVDSDPVNGASWYPTFGSSILGYASKWITYGYAHPRDWRYFGPQFGDKWIGMNVKYASDTYWSEKMAANYYSFDKALGLQDYNFYQLGVVTGKTNAYSSASTSSKFIYEYPEAEDALVIVDEVSSNGEKWYKVVSDLNINGNFDEITSGDYNWNGYVYVQASHVKKINEVKDTPSPNDVTSYQDSNYEYDMYVNGRDFQPKVGISTMDTAYYYDSSLTSSKGQTLLKDRYVIVYAAATENGKPISYLVTSDYFYSEKHWVAADSIRLTDTAYGKVTVDTSDNQYTWVNSNRQDIAETKIGGLYTYAYVPILESSNVDGQTWYKVPVSLSTNNNQYGYTLADYGGYIHIEVSKAVSEKHAPVITANDQTIIEGQKFDPRKEVSAWDQEDGDLTSSIVVEKNDVKETPGTYEVTYKVTDKDSMETTKTIKVTVKENKAPVINASDKTIVVNTEFNPKEGVSASDEEDGDLTDQITVKENKVEIDNPGTYKVVYEVSDTLGKGATKEIQVTVKEKQINEDDENIDDLLERYKEGEFNLNELTYNKQTKKFTISGYLIINNVKNIGKEYALVLMNVNDEEDIHIMEVDSWTKDVPFELGDNYEEAWFKGELDFTDIPNGDYELYMIAATEDAFTMQIVDNYLNIDIDRRGEDNNHGYDFKVNQRSRNKEIELSIRDELYTTSNPPTSRNMVNGYEEITFKNDKLYLYGYSYDYNGTYNNASKITRKLILEETTNFNQKAYDLGSKKGPFNIETQDKKDKSYAWFEQEIDLSDLAEGTYKLLLYTKTEDAEDYDEIDDIFRSLDEEKTIGDKTYRVTYNKDRAGRIELEVKKK